MLNIIRRTIRGKKNTSVEDNLKFYIGVSEQLVALGFFGAVFSYKLDVATYFGPAGISAPRFLEADFLERLPSFIGDKWPLILFAVFIFFWFRMYRTAVNSEMEILVKLYSRINPPHDWENTLGTRMIPLLSIGLTVAFFALAFFLDRPEIFCLIMLALSVQDALGNNLVRKNLLRHFQDPDFLPHDSDLHAPFIMKRREVALDYWVWRPQIERVGLMMIGTNLAFLAAISEPAFGIALPQYLPIAIIIAIILTNEIVISIWRIERDRRLEAIEDEQEEHERSMMRKAGEPPDAPGQA